MRQGYVYILSNPSMPRLVKIGKTERTVEQRANEIYQTGVPTPFVIDHAVLTPDCGELEATMHELFSSCRVNESREFFRITEDDVESLPDKLDSCLVEQIQRHVDQYLNDYHVMRTDFIVDDSDVNIIAEKSGYHPAEVASALSLVTPEELKPAVERFREISRLRALRRDHGLGLGSLDLKDIEREIEEKRRASEAVSLEVSNG